MKYAAALLAAVLVLWLHSARAQELPKVAIGISGWTGFAPLTLAKEAGIFKKNGLDVTIKKIPQKDRHLAIASGDVQCAATTVETWVAWNAMNTVLSAPGGSFCASRHRKAASASVTAPTLTVGGWSSRETGTQSR